MPKNSDSAADVVLQGEIAEGVMSGLLKESPFTMPAGAKAGDMQLACNDYFAACRERGGEDPDYGIGSSHTSTLDKTRAKGTPSEQARCKAQGKVYSGSTASSLTCKDK